jgi:hypothetical protein
MQDSGLRAKPPLCVLSEPVDDQFVALMLTKLGFDSTHAFY